jgi:uncharacterized protein
MNLQENVKIVQQAYENFKNGNIPALLESMADNVEWELPELEGVPAAGKRQGRNGVADFFAKLSETQQVVNFEPTEFVAQDEKVVVLGHYTWRVTASQGQFTSDWAHVFTVRNGRIERFQEYTDTAAVAAAYKQQRTRAA